MSMLSDSYVERRNRICYETGTNLHDYDLAYLFGYEPESWNGMYRLRARRPIIPLSKNYALAAEVVGMRRNRQKIRYRLVKARA